MTFVAQATKKKSGRQGWLEEILMDILSPAICLNVATRGIVLLPLNVTVQMMNILKNRQDEKSHGTSAPHAWNAKLPNGVRCSIENRLLKTLWQWGQWSMSIPVRRRIHTAPDSVGRGTGSG